MFVEESDTFWPYHIPTRGCSALTRTVLQQTVEERTHEHENQSSCGHVPRHRPNSPSCYTSRCVTSPRYLVVLLLSFSWHSGALLYQKVQLLVQGLFTGVWVQIMMPPCGCGHDCVSHGHVVTCWMCLGVCARSSLSGRKSSSSCCRVKV